MLRAVELGITVIFSTNLFDSFESDVIRGVLIEVFPPLSCKQVVEDHSAERVCYDGNFAFKARLMLGQFSHDQIHLLRHCLENPRPEPRVEIGDAVRYCIIKPLFGLFPVGWHRHQAQPMAKAERLLNFSLPIDNMRDYLVLALQVTTVSYLLDCCMKLVFRLLLTLVVSADSMD